jgi:hypothetical protein
VDTYDDYPYGSSVSNADYARYNVVMQNQIYKRSVDEMITNRLNLEANSPNYIGYNETVTEAIDRLAGCYVADGYKKDFILHGETIDLFTNENGEPTCKLVKYRLMGTFGDVERGDGIESLRARKAGSSMRR